MSKAIAAMLFGTEPGDPVAFTGMVIALCVVSLAAGWIPARRASRINPMVALRNN